MTGCCDPREYDRVFTRKYARRKAESWRTSGSDELARLLIDFLAAQGVSGATVLEVGGGVGSLHLELLRRGAATATNLELSSTYDHEAAQLLAETGLADRVDRRILDLAVAAEAVPAADLVVLNRVVCCYPDFEALLSAVADRTCRAVAFSYPRPRFLTRAETWLENVGYAIRGRKFRSFVHSPPAMLAVLERHGLTPVFADRTAMWQVSGAVRR